MQGSGGTAWYSSYGLNLANQWSVDNQGATCVGCVVFSGTNTMSNGFSSNSPMPVNEWTHIAVTFDVTTGTP